VTVEAYVVWKIADNGNRDDAVALKNEKRTMDQSPVVRFFRTLGSNEVAEARLTSRLQSILTEQVGRVELSDLLRAKNSESGPSTGAGPFQELSAKIRNELSLPDDEGSSLLERMGLEIVDLRIKRLNLPTGNMQSVFDRMRSERQKIAERYRSAGLAENRMIRSQADRQAGELMAKAQAEAERIRGDADAKSIRILNDAYSRDPHFASILQTLDAYRQILNDRTTLILSASNVMLKLLVEGIPSADVDTSKPASVSTGAP